VSLTEDEIKKGLEEIQREGAQTTSNSQQAAGASEDMDTAQDSSESRSIVRSEEAQASASAAASEENTIQQAAKNAASRINNRPTTNTANQLALRNDSFPPLQQRSNFQNSGSRNSTARVNHNNSYNVSQDSRNTYADQARMGGQRPPRFGGEFTVQQRLQQMSNEDVEANGGHMYDEYGFFDPSRFITA